MRLRKTQDMETPISSGGGVGGGEEWKEVKTI